MTYETGKVLCILEDYDENNLPPDDISIQGGRFKLIYTMPQYPKYTNLDWSKKLKETHDNMAKNGQRIDDQQAIDTNSATTPNIDVTCRTCGITGHMAINCNYNIHCRKCGAADHWAADCLQEPT